MTSRHQGEPLADIGGSSGSRIGVYPWFGTGCSEVTSNRRQETTMRNLRVIVALVLSLALIAGCSGGDRDDDTGLANPASVFCEEQGGTLEIRTDEAGQYGVCVFDDGSECEEWAYYRGECARGG